MPLADPAADREADLNARAHSAAIGLAVADHQAEPSYETAARVQSIQRRARELWAARPPLRLVS